MELNEKTAIFSYAYDIIILGDTKIDVVLYKFL